MKLRVAAVVALLIGGAFQTAAALPSPAVVLAQRTLKSNETYSDTVVVLAGTVTVPPGASLTFERVRVIGTPGATLSVAGGIVSMTDVDGQGFTLSVFASGTGQLERVSMSHAPGDLVIVDASVLNLTDVDLSDAGIAAIRATDSTVSASGLSISGAQGYQVALYGTDFTASDLTLVAATEYGMYVESGSVDVAASSFTGHCGVYLSQGTTGSLGSSTFQTIDHGLTLYRTGVVSIDDVSFNGGSVAVTAVGTTLDATDVSAVNVTQGILAYDAGGTVTGGALAASVGVDVGGTGVFVPVLRSLDLSAAVTGVRNVTSLTVDARWNWWGGTPGGSATAGLVDVSPWLAAPPA